MLTTAHAVAPVLAAAAGLSAMLLLAVAVAYACATKEEEQSAARTEGMELTEQQQASNDAYVAEQIRLLEEKKRREFDEHRAKERQEKAAKAAAKAAEEEEEQQRAAAAAAAALRAAEEQRQQRQRRQRRQQQEEESEKAAAVAAAAAEEEANNAAAEAKAAEAAAVASAEKEDFPELEDDDDDDAFVNGDVVAAAAAEGGGALGGVVTMDHMVKEMVAGTYVAPRTPPPAAPALSVSTQRGSPKRRLSALDSPYGRMLARSPERSKKSVAQLLYSAYPGLGVQVLQEFLEEVGVEFETDLGLLEEADVRNLDTGKFDSETQEKLWKAVSKHREKIGKKASSLRKSITVVDPDILPAASGAGPAKDLTEWYCRFEISEETQAVLKELGVESVGDVNFLEKADMVGAGLDGDTIDIIMNAIALKKLQDRRAGPRKGAIL